MDLAGVVRGVALQGSEILFSGLCIVIIAVWTGMQWKKLSRAK